MASKRKHNSCTLKENKGESATQLSKEFGVGKATISDWKKNRGKIEQFCTTTSEKTIEKRSKTTVSSYEKLNEALFLCLLEDNEELTILDKLKKMNIKDVIYWVAEAWENTRKESLQKSWKNLWPELEFVKTVFPPTKENCKLLQLVKRMPGCEKAEEECVEEWTAVDDCGHEEYTDEDIVAAVQGTSADLDADGSEEEGDAPTDVVPHTAAASALDLALRYVEQHADATPTALCLCGVG
ncbi:JERKL protein, partial [Polypterus senegalus]